MQFFGFFEECFAVSQEEAGDGDASAREGAEVLVEFRAFFA